MDSIHEEVEIEFIQTNFEVNSFPFQNLDGILMANSLHYLKEKFSFIKGMEKYLNVNSQFLVVEYDTEKSNSWVPYPIKFSMLTQLFESCGFNRIEKIGERQSTYRMEKMYACSISRSGIQ